MYVAYLLRNGWTDLAKLFFLAPSWSRDGFRAKKFRIRDLFGLKPSHDQDGANKKKFSQIGPAVLEEIGRKHTHKHRVAI